MGPAPKWHLYFNSNQRFNETLARHAGKYFFFSKDFFDKLKIPCLQKMYKHGIS